MRPRHSSFKHARITMFGIAVLTGCSASGTEPQADAPAPADGPSVGASVTGNVSSSLKGSGWFNEGTDRQTQVFMVSATDSTGGTPQSIILMRRGGGRPNVGTYPLHFRVLDDPADVGYSGTYSRQGNGMSDSYGSLSGTLTITESTSDRVVGSFQFEGVRFCSRNAQGGTCYTNTLPPADAPRVQVSGTFTAKRNSGGR